jgi:hypothetical protein
MDDQKRLDLIAEAVRYCQRVRAMGMPPSSYTKALREPIYFLWELRAGKPKDRCAQYRSRESLGVKRVPDSSSTITRSPFTCSRKTCLI